MYCFSKVCFMCLKYIDIENYTNLQPVGKKIVQQMKFILPEIALEPHLPLLICSTCRQVLDNFYNFKNICIENSCRYKDYINKLKGPHGSFKGTFGDLQVKINDYTLLITEEENIDSNIETEKLVLKEVMLDFTEELYTSEDSTDPLYQKNIKNGKESKHGEDCDRNINCLEQTTEEKNDFIEYKFLDLKAEENLLEEEVDIKEIQDFNEELSISDDNKDSLPLKILKNETQFNQVKDSDRKITEDKNHSNEQKVTNDLCQATDLKCLICNAGFVEKSQLENHMMAHYNVKQRKCLFCDKIFKYVWTLRRHMTTHTNVVNYKCSICNKMFVEKYKLQRHMIVHTGVKDYKCSICNKMFAQRYHLKMHMTVHTGVKDNKCSICNKMFALNKTLKIHMAVHSDVKDYKCSICKKTFKRRTNLKTHMLLHTGVKYYKCSICNKLFMRKDSLKVHMKRHTGVKEFECFLCNKKFVLKHNLVEHVKCHKKKKQDK